MHISIQKYRSSLNKQLHAKDFVDRVTTAPLGATNRALLCAIASSCCLAGMDMDPVIASKISACQTYLSAFDKAMADAGNTTKSNDQAVTMTKNDAIEIALASGGAVASIKAVPVAMSMFGKIVSGVGTLHASKAAGGLAATLQSSAFLPCLLAVSYGYLLYKKRSAHCSSLPKTKRNFELLIVFSKINHT